jgi:hypothetical protein
MERTPHLRKRRHSRRVVGGKTSNGPTSGGMIAINSQKSLFFRGIGPWLRPRFWAISLHSVWLCAGCKHGTIELEFGCISPELR